MAGCHYPLCYINFLPFVRFRSLFFSFQQKRELCGLRLGTKNTILDRPGKWFMCPARMCIATSLVPRRSCQKLIETIPSGRRSNFVMQKEKSFSTCLLSFIFPLGRLVTTDEKKNHHPRVSK